MNKINKLLNILLEFSNSVADPKETEYFNDITGFDGSFFVGMDNKHQVDLNLYMNLALEMSKFKSNNKEITSSQEEILKTKKLTIDFKTLRPKNNNYFNVDFQDEDGVEYIGLIEIGILIKYTGNNAFYKELPLSNISEFTNSILNVMKTTPTNKKDISISNINDLSKIKKIGLDIFDLILVNVEDSLLVVSKKVINGEYPSFLLPKGYEGDLINTLYIMNSNIKKQLNKKIEYYIKK